MNANPDSEKQSPDAQRQSAAWLSRHGAQIASALDAELAELDVPSQLRLHAARERALALVRNAPPRALRFWQLAGFGGACALAWFALPLWVPNAADHANDAGAAATESQLFALLEDAQTDTELPSAALAPEALADFALDADVAEGFDAAEVSTDLEFYAWFAENARAAGASGAAGS